MIGIVITAAAILATALPASAAPGQVIHEHFNGEFAEALWFTSTPASDTSTYVRASQSGRAGSLVAEQVIQSYDAQHNITGATDTVAEVSGGYTFSIDAVNLDTASVNGAVPATTCTFNANFELIGCEPGTLSLDVTWTGQGVITHSTSSSHIRAGALSFTDHLNGTSRDGTATGTAGGVTLVTSEYAVLGQAVSGSTFLCVGNSC